MMLSTMMLMSSSRNSMMNIAVLSNHRCTRTVVASIGTATTNSMVRTVFTPRPILMMAAMVGRNNNNSHVDMSTMTSPDGKPLLSSNHKHFPLPNAKGSVIYTETDEAPALATYSLYPVVAKVRQNIYMNFFVYV